MANYKSAQAHKAFRDKFREAVEFVKQFDYLALDRQTIDSMFAQLEGRVSEP